MSYRRNLSRLGVASLLVAAVSAPAASAMPTDPQTTVDPAHAPAYVPPTTRSDAAQLDMHASTVHKPQPASADLRSEAAKDPIPADGLKPTPGTNARRPLPGPPVFPTSTDVLVPPKQQPVATTGGDGGDVEWPIAVISIGGALLIGGGLGAAGYKYRVSARPAH